MGKGYSPVVEQKIITQLKRGVKAPRNIAKQAHLNPSTVRVALSKMARSGQVKRLADGTGYALRTRTTTVIRHNPLAAGSGSAVLGTMLKPNGEQYPWPPTIEQKPVSRAKVVIVALVILMVLIWVL